MTVQKIAGRAIDIFRQMVYNDCNKFLEVIMTSSKSRLVTTLLAFLIGGLGVDLFYVGKIGKGVFQILLSVIYVVLYVVATVLAIVPVIGWILAVILYIAAAGVSLGSGIWQLARAIVAVCGKATDKDGALITEWNP